MKKKFNHRYAARAALFVMALFTVLIAALGCICWMIANDYFYSAMSSLIVGLGAVVYLSAGSGARR